MYSNPYYISLFHFPHNIVVCTITFLICLYLPLFVQVGKFIQLMSTFFGGFVVAFINGWKLTLVLLSMIPLLALAGGAMAMITSKMTSRGQQAYAEAGNVVEQTTGAIRTVRI